MDELSYSLRVFQRLSSHNESLLATDLRVDVAMPIEWVREHADEIAARGVNVLRFGQPVALWLTVHEGSGHAIH